MDTTKALTKDQLDTLKETVRQRFDNLFQRIGINRQKLTATVLAVDQALNKELAKKKIDIVREKAILREVKEIERIANKQLPHVHKIPDAAHALKPSTTEAPAKVSVKEKKKTD